MQVSFGLIDPQVAETPQTPSLEAVEESEDFREVLEDAESAETRTRGKHQKEHQDDVDRREASKVASEVVFLDPSLAPEAEQLPNNLDFTVSRAQAKDGLGASILGAIADGEGEKANSLSLVFSESKQLNSPSLDLEGNSGTQDIPEGVPLDGKGGDPRILDESKIEKAPLEIAPELESKEAALSDIPKDLPKVPAQDGETVTPSEDARPADSQPVESSPLQNADVQAPDGEGVNPDPSGGSQLPDHSGHQNSSTGSHDNPNAAAFGLESVATDPASTDVSTKSEPVIPDPITSDEIIKQVKLNVRTGTSRINFMVDPPELGRLNIQLTIRNGRLTGQITAESGAVEKALLAGLDGLKATMRDAGVHVDSLDVQIKSKAEEQGQWAPASDERQGETPQGRKDRQEDETRWETPHDSAEPKMKQTHASADGINIIA